MDEAMSQPPELPLSPAAATTPAATIEGAVQPMPAHTTPENMDISDDDGSIGVVLSPPKPTSLSTSPSSLPATPLDDLHMPSSPALDPALIRSNSSSSLDKPSSPDSHDFISSTLHSFPVFQPPELLPSPAAATSPAATIEGAIQPMPVHTTPENMDISDDDGGIGVVLSPPRPSSLSTSPPSLPATPLDVLDMPSSPGLDPALIRSNSSSSLDMPSAPDSIDFNLLAHALFDKDILEEYFGEPIDQIFSPEPSSTRPELQEFSKEDTNQVTQFNKLRVSDSDVSYHPDGQILSLQALPQTSNPFAPTDLVISSSSHHVPSSLESILHGQSSRPVAIPYHYLQKITDHFSKKRILGQGGFGVVYKGVPQNGEMIAVKRINPSFVSRTKNQFDNEVFHLMRLKHPNIVGFKGYCYETQNECLEHNGTHIFAEEAERLLCLEYLPNGSLDKYLSDESSGLDWRTRYKIIEGICHGLCHLHEQVGKPIIHLDLKPANILLDDAMVPKITDFGLSRLLDQQQTISTSYINGTLGYMAPEFLHRGTITPKSDIFSLGVIIMEVITGHRDYLDITTASSDDYIELALTKWRGVLQKPPGYESLETDLEQIKRCIQIGLVCVNPDRKKRPPITKVISMLQGLDIIDCDITNEEA